jgi:nicotinamide riboside transporter PnuC
MNYWVLLRSTLIWTSVCVALSVGVAKAASYIAELGTASFGQEPWWPAVRFGLGAVTVVVMLLIFLRLGIPKVRGDRNAPTS